MNWSRVMYTVFSLLFALNVNVDSLELGKCAGVKGDREKCLKHILKGGSGKSIQNKLSHRNSETSPTDRQTTSAGKTFERIAEMATNFWDFTRDLLDIRGSKITFDDDLRTQEITRANRHFRRFLLSFLIGVMLKLGAFFPVIVAGLFLLGNTAFVFGKTALFLSGLIAFLRHYFYYHSGVAHDLSHKTERLDRYERFAPGHHRPEYYYHDLKLS